MTKRHDPVSTLEALNELYQRYDGPIPKHLLDAAYAIDRCVEAGRAKQSKEEYRYHIAKRRQTRRHQITRRRRAENQKLGRGK